MERVGWCGWWERSDTLLSPEGTSAVVPARVVWVPVSWFGGLVFVPGVGSGVACFFWFSLVLRRDCSPVWGCGVVGGPGLAVV